MGRGIGLDKSAGFTGKFRKGDRVVVSVPPPFPGLPRPRGVIFESVPRQAGYLVRYSNGVLAGWQEDELRPAFGHMARRAWQAVLAWWRRRSG